jgi:RNA polymerase sigma-70 factor (ECF subfamily)
VSGAGNNTPSYATETTRVTLLVGLQTGDAEAWRRMVAIYGPFIYGLCRRWGLSPEDASDASQETFRAAAIGMGAFRADRERGTFRGWLRTIARNKAHDLWRRRAADLALGEGGSHAQTLLAQAPDPWDDHEDNKESPNELAGLVRRTLDLLRSEFEPATWQAFWEMAVAGRQAAEIGAELNVSANAVRVAKCKVLRRLREELGDNVGHLLHK